MNQLIKRMANIKKECPTCTGVGTIGCKCKLYSKFLYLNSTFYTFRQTASLHDELAIVSPNFLYLAMEKGQSVRRTKVLCAVLQAIEENYDLLEEKGFDVFSPLQVGQVSLFINMFAILLITLFIQYLNVNYTANFYI